MKLITAFWSLIIFSSFALAEAAKKAPPPPGNESGSGGDAKIQKNFADGFRLAILMIEKADTKKFPADTQTDLELIAFVEKERGKLIDELNNSPQEWVSQKDKKDPSKKRDSESDDSEEEDDSDDYKLCGRTEQKTHALIKFYTRNCATHTVEDAARVWITEAAHHCGKYDSWASYVATTIVNAFPKKSADSVKDVSARLNIEAYHGNFREVGDLLNPPHYANPNVKESKSLRTPVLYAVLGGCHWRVLELLFAKGAYAESRDYRQKSALDYLLLRKEHDIVDGRRWCDTDSLNKSVKLVVKALGDQEQTDMAVRNFCDNPEYYPLALDLWNSVAPSTAIGSLCLFQSLKTNHLDSFRAFLTKATPPMLAYELDDNSLLGRTLASTSIEKYTSRSLHQTYTKEISLTRPKYEDAESLLNMGASVHKGVGRTPPLMLASTQSIWSNPKMVKRLIELGGDINYKDSNGFRPVDWAATFYVEYEKRCTGDDFKDACNKKLSHVYGALKNAGKVEEVFFVPESKWGRLVPHSESGTYGVVSHSVDGFPQYGYSTSKDYSFWCKAAKTACTD